MRVDAEEFSRTSLLGQLVALTISYVQRQQQRSSKQRQAADGRGDGAKEDDKKTAAV